MSRLSRRQFAKVLGLAAFMPLIAQPARAATHAVSIQGMKFVPDSLSVAVGDTVTFTNEDGAPHTATADNGSFDTGRLKKGESASITIGAAGEHSYFCAVHRSMKAVITAA